MSHYYQLNASSFGLPQNRPRLLMISVFVGEDQAAAKVVKDFFSININNSANLKPNQIFLIPNKFENNICLDDINYQIINLNEISKSNIMPNIVRHSGKDIIKKIINNDINNNFENKENKLNHSCKKVTFFLKQRIKGIKLKRDRFLNDVHKISINAQMSEINKSNK